MATRSDDFRRDDQADLRVGDWRVRPRRMLIEGESGSVKIEPRAMQVLLALCRGGGDVVRREALLDDVWSGGAVTDEALTRVIFDLRRAFGDPARASRVIETVHKVGYRLMVPVTKVAPDDDAAETSLPSPPRLTGRWLALRVARWFAPLVLISIAFAAVSWIRAGRLPIESSAIDPTESTFAPPRLAYGPVRQLTSLRGYETRPSLSPAGDFVIYARDDRGDGNIDLFRRRLDGDTPTRLTTSRAADDLPAISPDGRRVAFVRTASPASGSRDAEPCALMILDLAADAERRLASCRDAAISPPSWMPDGRTLLLADRAEDGSPYRILGVDLATGATRPWTVPPENSFGDLFPAVSPDGRSLAFVRATARSTIATYLSPVVGDIVTIPAVPLAAEAETETESEAAAETVAPNRITRDDAEVPGLAWSSDGRHLIFASTRSGRGYALWAASVDGRTFAMLHDGRGRLLRNPTVARESGEIAFESWRGAQDIWHVSLVDAEDAVAGRRIVDSTRSDFNPQIAPDGTRIAFTSSRSGSPEIWIAGLEDGAEARRVTRFEGRAQLEGPRWSPDGTRLVFEARSGGQSTIWRVDTDGGVLRRLTDPDYESRSPSWSFDGRRIFFASHLEDGWQIWSLPADGGTLARETRDGGFASRHGLIDGVPTLLVSSRDRDGVHRVEDSGPSRQVAALASEHWGNFELLGSSVVTVVLRGAPTRVTELWSTDVRTGARRRLGVVEGWISRETPSLSIASDGRSALVARFEGLAADLLLLTPAAEASANEGR